MKTISWNEILALSEAGHPVLCIDVREAYRHRSFDAGGNQIPFNQISRYAAQLMPHKAVLTVVCCLRPTGSKRTVKAASELHKLGFTDVRELKNGLYTGWIQKVGSTVKLPKLIET
ncbi:MAG: rhodanese-like domain-containing protein [Saprospiraceae bacterium]|nr:rhodanese-like domain-containing protein [Lewinellaceae bacterium]